MSFYNGTHAFTWLKQLSFPRLGGTSEENRAAKIIKNALNGLGVPCSLEPFKVRTYNKAHASLEVLVPYRKTYPALAVGLTGNTPKSGITREMIYLTAYNDLAMKKAKSKIAMFYRNIPRKFYSQLAEHKIPAFIQVVDYRTHRSPSALMHIFIKKYGRIPGITIDYDTGLELIHRRAKRVRVYTSQDEFWGKSHNILATIKGKAFPAETILVCAHYDSVKESPGALDNAGGSVSLIEFARYFKQYPPLRTIQFIWFGSEELGLLGSCHYVRKHQSVLNNIKLVLNMDIAGAILGTNRVWVSGSPGLKNFITSLSLEQGIPLELNHGAYSSDNIPFNDYGIPSASFNRGGGIYGHSPRDGSVLVDAQHLQVMGELSLEFLKKIANAIEWPFPLNIDDKDRELVDKYVTERLVPRIKPPKR